MNTDKTYELGPYNIYVQKAFCVIYFVDMLFSKEVFRGMSLWQCQEINAQNHGHGKG